MKPKQPTKISAIFVGEGNFLVTDHRRDFPIISFPQDIFL